jgi:hypothetical protein
MEDGNERPGVAAVIERYDICGSGEHLKSELNKRRFGQPALTIATKSWLGIVC